MVLEAHLEDHPAQWCRQFPRREAIYLTFLLTRALCFDSGLTDYWCFDEPILFLLAPKSIKKLLKLNQIRQGWIKYYQWNCQQWNSNSPLSTNSLHVRNYSSYTLIFYLIFLHLIFVSQPIAGNQQLDWLYFKRDKWDINKCCRIWCVSFTFLGYSVWCNSVFRIFTIEFVHFSIWYKIGWKRTLLCTFIATSLYNGVSMQHLISIEPLLCTNCAINSAKLCLLWALNFALNLVHHDIVTIYLKVKNSTIFQPSFPNGIP